MGGREEWTAEISGKNMATNFTGKFLLRQLFPFTAENLRSPIVSRHGLRSCVEHGRTHCPWHLSEWLSAMRTEMRSNEGDISLACRNDWPTSI